jgi:hypothetical protein
MKVAVTLITSHFENTVSASETSTRRESAGFIVCQREIDITALRVHCHRTLIPSKSDESPAIDNVILCDPGMPYAWPSLASPSPGSLP